MAKIAKKAVKKPVKSLPKKKRTIEDRLDFIEAMITAIAYVISNAEIEVVKKAAKKAVKKAKK